MFISIQFFPQCIMRSAQRCHAEGGRVPFGGSLGKAWETQQSSTFFAPGTDWFRRGLGEGGEQSSGEHHVWPSSSQASEGYLGASSSRALG